MTPLPISEDRCPWAIQLGALGTRCALDRGHTTVLHTGRGLAEFDYQRWSWLAGDHREFLTDRTDIHAWEFGVSQ